MQPKTFMGDVKYVFQFYGGIRTNGSCGIAVFESIPMSFKICSFIAVELNRSLWGTAYAELNLQTADTRI